MQRIKFISVICDCKGLLTGSPRNTSPVKVQTLFFYLFLLFVVKGTGLFVKFIILFCLNPLAQVLKDTWVMEFVFKEHSFSYTTVDAILLGIFLAPVAEEFIFRGPLVWSKKMISLSFSLFFLHIFSNTSINFIVSRCDWQNLEQVKVVIINVVISILIYSVSFVCLSVFEHEFAGMHSRSKKFIFFLSSTIFAGLHLLNSDITFYSLFLAPVFVLPFFLSGIFFSYVRIKYGLKYSILLHILSNGVVITISLCFLP